MRFRFAILLALSIAFGSSIPPANAAKYMLQPGDNLPSTLSEIRHGRGTGKIAPDETVNIILHGGIYSLAQPLELSAMDSGIEFAAAPGEHPIFTGGVEITDWKKMEATLSVLSPIAAGKIMVADAPKVNGKIVEFRQLWVNGRKAVRARNPNENFFRLAAWDKLKRTATIPAIALAGTANAPGLEMFVDQVWEIADLRVAKIRIAGTNAVVSFKSPESGLEFQHPWPPVIVNSHYAAPFYLDNAIEFLDSPGEWFEDLRAEKIYYWPRDGENLARARVVAPVLETLLEISGSRQHPVTNLQFQGITFADTTWLRPSHEGHVPLQASMFMLAAHKLSPPGTSYHPKLDNVAWVGRPPAAVSVKDADSISFERCTFEHTASAGLDFEDDTHNDLVKGCVFRDIGGNGIQLGRFSDVKTEVHMPWNPADLREICSDEEISDNLISNCAAEDWGCVGIDVGYVRGVKIEHNDISDLPYSGISVGWGWTKRTNALRDNFIFANRIHDVGNMLGDLGGIYLLSAQPGTVVAENCVYDMKPSAFVPDPKHWFYLYADEGSAFETWRDNWCPAEKFMRNANGPDNVWTNNGPQVSEKIKSAAGLEPAFQDLLSAKP